MRFLGLDVGKKNVGVAAGEVLAEELTTIRAPKETDFYSPSGQEIAFKTIQKILNEQQADSIVIGLPVNEAGDMTAEATKIQHFGNKLQEFLNIDIHFVNETLTTFMAQDMLESQGIGSAEAAMRVDQLAAQLILQQFLEEDALR